MLKGVFTSPAIQNLDRGTLEMLEEAFLTLQTEPSSSLLKRHLKRETFDLIKNLKTPGGAVLLDCIKSGIIHADSVIGLYAADPESYTVFAPIFNPIIEDYHEGFKSTDKHPLSDFGNLDTIVDVDPTGTFVVSIRLRCVRNLEEYAFNPCLDEVIYKKIEEKVSTIFGTFEGELKGKYHPLTGMDKATQKQLIDGHFLFKEGDKFLQAANAYRYWPAGRGIYHNDDKTFLVWCNEEDHLRIISMQKGGDLKAVFQRLVNAVNNIESKLPFSRDERLGYLTFCPTNIGTTIRASVLMKLPKLRKNMKIILGIAYSYHLEVRGSPGEQSEEGIFTVSNQRCVGLTEYQVVKELQDGILEMIKMEQAAE